MDSSTLYAAVAEVSPVVATSVGDANDRTTWQWTPGANATQAQIDAGNNVVDTIPVEIKPTLASSEFIGRFTNAEYRAAIATTWRQTGPNAKDWDVVVFDPVINLNKKKVTTLRDSLVVGGILTQARADEIFS